MAKSTIQPENAVRSRPNMPHYGITTETEGLLDWGWVDKRMEKSRNYWICTTRPDGRPNASPVWGVWVEDKLYFGCHKKSRKAINVDHNPQVVVHLESGDETVIFEGKLVQIDTSGDLMKALDEAYFIKYPPFHPAESLDENSLFYVLEPHIVMAWMEESYPKTATRWVFDN